MQHIPSWREARWERIEIVQEYLKTLTNERMLLVAYLLMQDLSEDKIMLTLHLSTKELCVTKTALALGLRAFGLQLRD